MTKEEVFMVVDRGGSRHDSHGTMAICYTEKEAEALRAELDGQWDGCEGSFNIKVVPMEIGLHKHIKRHFFCLHDWALKHHPEPIFVCKKCKDRWSEVYSKAPPPKFSGIAYYDEKTKKLIYADKGNKIMVK